MLRTLVFWMASIGAQASPLTIERAVSLAVEKNERARVSAAQAKAAESRIARARAFFFPQLTLSGAYTRRLHESVRTISGNPVVIQRHDALSAQANLVVPLFDVRLFPLYRQAKLESQSAAQTAAEERRLLGYEAADSFLRVLGEQQVTQAARRRLEFSRASLRDMRARAAAGLVSSNDVTRGELETATAERELTVATASATASLLELGQLVNEPVGGTLANPDTLLKQADRGVPDAKETIAAGLRNRMDIAAGRSRVLALEAAAAEPGLRVVPSVAAVGQYRMTNEGGLSGRSGDGFAGLTAAWPLWDGGERSAEKAERKSLVEAEVASQEARVRGVALDVRRAIEALQSARSAQTTASKAAELAERNVQETAELYRQGLVGALEVADANLRLFEAEVALVRERYGLALAYLDLRAASGERAPGMENSKP